MSLAPLAWDLIPSLGLFHNLRSRNMHFMASNIDHYLPGMCGLSEGHEGIFHFSVCGEYIYVDMVHQGDGKSLQKAVLLC